MGKTKNEMKEAGTEAAEALNEFLDDDWGAELAEPDIDGFWSPEIQPVIRGRIIGHKVMPGDDETKPSDLVVIQADEPTRVKVKGSDDTTTLEAGAKIGVTVRAKLLPLLEYVEHRCKVRVEALEKVAIKGGRRRMWKFSIRAAVGSKRGAYPASSIAARGVAAPAAVHEDDGDAYL